MTVNVSKPVVNVREKLAELDKPTGIAGEAMLRADTVPDQAELLGYRQQNVLINGAMQVAQRGNLTGHTSGNSYGAVDRWGLNLGSSVGTWKLEQGTGTNAFANSVKATCTTAGSVSASDFVVLNQRLEGQNLFAFNKGTSDAKHFTLSFWVKASVAGTYSCELNDQDNTRYSGHAYTVNQADTWEYKVLVFSPDTTGAFGDDNNSSLQVSWWIGAGSNYTSGTITNGKWHTTTVNRVADLVNMYTTVNSTFELTGVQLVAGNYPDGLPFMHRSYGEELALCQRYYTRMTHSSAGRSFAVGGADSATASVYVVALPQTLRANPQITTSNVNIRQLGSSTNLTISSISAISHTSGIVNLHGNVASGFTAGTPTRLRANAVGAYIEFKAEL